MTADGGTAGPIAAAAAGGWGLFGAHPPGLSTLFFTELWERFSYYGMRALLVLFMVAPASAGGLGFDTGEAARLYGSYTMAVYMLAIPGGYIADTVLGARSAVVIGGGVIALGHFTLAVPALSTFYLGLLLIALGTGLFKPTVSGMVGALYASGDERRDAGFSIYYMGINIGAFLAPLVTGFLAQSATFKGWLEAAGLDPDKSWHWGFAAAGIGMTAALVIFARQAGRLGHAGARPTERNGQNLGVKTLLVLLGTGALMALTLLSDVEGYTGVRWLFLAVPVAAALWLARSPDAERKRMAAVFVLFVAAMVFWALFEQAGVSIALFADELTRSEALGMTFPSSWFQSLNALFVILLTPIFAYAWVRLGARQPSSPAKFVAGLVFLALSFLIMVPAAQLTAAGKVSPLWLVALFFLQTVGELFLSPVGLSTMTKIAPRHLVGVVLGIWFLASAFGNKLAGVFASGFTAGDAPVLAAFFLDLGLLALGVGLLLLLLVPWVKRLMGGVR